ncbi:hypothetical protein YC2023_024071 [Brassica napus]
MSAWTAWLSPSLRTRVPDWVVGLCSTIGTSFSMASSKHLIFTAHIQERARQKRILRSTTQFLPHTVP